MIKRCFFIWFLLALAMPSGAETEPAEFPAYDKALIAYLSGDFKASLEQVNFAIRTDSHFYPAYALRARLANLAGLSSEMDKDVQKVISKLGSNRSLSSPELIARGTALQLADRNDEALENFNAVIKMNPDSAEALAGRARVLRAQGKSADALADLNILLSKETRFPLYFYDRAYCYYDSNLYDSAVTDLVTALRLNPQFYPAYGLLGAALAKNADFARAEQAYTRGININPHYPFAYTGRAQLYLAQGKREEAMKDFALAIGINSKDYAPYYNRAEALWSQGQKEDALADYRKALSCNNFPQ